MVKIKIVNPVDCEIISGVKDIYPALSFESETYRKVQWGNKRVSARKTFIRKGKYFLTGFLNRVQSYCEQNNIQLEIDDPDGDLSFLPSKNEPMVEGKNIREGKWAYQLELIKTAVDYQRGIIKAATGSGKTTMMLGVISCYPFSQVLFLSNSHTPLTQFKKALEESQLDKTKIDISTIQSFHKKPPKEYVDKYDIIIIDEAHEGLRSTGSMYGKVLRKSLAPMRLGFTATLPDNFKARMTMEGLLGPVIGELTIQEGTDIGVLAKPKILLKMLPVNPYLKQFRNYQDVYHHGVVASRALNRQIVKDAISDSEEGTVLILVTEIEHGRNIIGMAKSLYGQDFTFVNGAVDKDVREEIRQRMIGGKTRVVIATAVFKKALDVPGLSSVINACGGKAECQTLQMIGRGLRNVTGDKEWVKIRDYFNPNSVHLIKHFGYRLTLYFEEGWLGEEN